MRLYVALAGAVFLASPAAASAQPPAPYNQSIDVPPLDVSRYVQEVSELNDYYLHNPSAGGSFNDRIRRRNAEVRARFARLRREREPLLRAHQVYFFGEVRCHNNHPGGHKSCPGTHEFGPGYEILPGSYGNDGSGFHTPVTLSGPSGIYWNQRKTGQGTNSGHVWAAAHYSAAHIPEILANEADALRTQLRGRNLPDDRSVDPEGD